jgi:hypothetical protein
VGIFADVQSPSADPSIPEHAIDRSTDWRSVRDPSMCSITRTQEALLD